MGAHSVGRGCKLVTAIRVIGESNREDDLLLVLAIFGPSTSIGFDPGDGGLGERRVFAAVSALEDLSDLAQARAPCESMHKDVALRRGEVVESDTAPPLWMARPNGIVHGCEIPLGQPGGFSMSGMKRHGE